MERSKRLPCEVCGDEHDHVLRVLYDSGVDTTIRVCGRCSDKTAGERLLEPGVRSVSTEGR